MTSLVGLPGVLGRLLVVGSCFPVLALGTSSSTSIVVLSADRSRISASRKSRNISDVFSGVVFVPVSIVEAVVVVWVLTACAWWSWMFAICDGERGGEAAGSSTVGSGLVVVASAGRIICTITLNWWYSWTMSPSRCSSCKISMWRQKKLLIA